MNNKLYAEVYEAMRLAKVVLIDLAQTGHCEDLPLWNRGEDGYEAVQKLTACLDKFDEGDTL